MWCSTWYNFTPSNVFIIYANDMSQAVESNLYLYAYDYFLLSLHK